MDVAIVVGLLATAVRLWGMAPIDRWLNRPAPLLQIGTPLSMLPNPGESTGRTLVLFVDAACPACRASVEFYRELARLGASGEPAVRILAAAPANGVDATRQWLDDIGFRM